MPIDYHVFCLFRDADLLVVAVVVDDTRHLRHSWKACWSEAWHVEALRQSRNVEHVIRVHVQIELIILSAL